jgi:hypothetical protein
MTMIATRWDFASDGGSWTLPQVWRGAATARCRSRQADEAVRLYGKAGPVSGWLSAMGCDDDHPEGPKPDRHETPDSAGAPRAVLRQKVGADASPSACRSLSHVNARLTVHGRAELVRRVVNLGRPVAHVVIQLNV